MVAVDGMVALVVVDGVPVMAGVVVGAAATAVGTRAVVVEVEPHLFKGLPL